MLRIKVLEPFESYLSLFYDIHFHTPDNTILYFVPDFLMTLGDPKHYKPLFTVRFSRGMCEAARRLLVS